jgi:hypothetical protein
MVSNYRRGMYCPVELWNALIDRLEPGDVVVVLDGLTDELQRVLREVYLERPWSLRETFKDSDVRREIERWCKHDAS